MKKVLLPILALSSIVFFSSCAHRYYTSETFEQQSVRHRVIAILPAEMIFTGNQPKNISAEDISLIEETESLTFQNSLYNGILKHANTRKYTTYVSVQDISTTQQLLKGAGISVRDSWKEDDRKLAQLLNVDAVVRMRVQKKRYMSDLASLGISVGQQILSSVAAGVPTPWVPNRTNDIFASCNVVSNNLTLWNDSYEGSANYATPSETVINNITERFGRNFPYRKRR